MTRRRYLIAYDICDDRRLRRTFTLMKGYGTPLQYSIFLCDLSEREKMRWEADIRDIMNVGVDSVISVEIGTAGTEVSVIGAPRRFPPGGPMIV